MAWEATGPRRTSGLAADKNVRAPALAALCSQLANNFDYCSAETSAWIKALNAITV
jgi:hypothetical protein